MARKEFPEDEPWSSPRGNSARAEVDIDGADGDESAGTRVLDLRPEQDSPFLRTQKRVPVRRGPLPKKTAVKLKYVLVGIAALAALAGISVALYRYGRDSWRFRLDSSDQIQLTGNQNVSRSQVMEIFGPDMSRNIFAIPLSERQAQLERLPWAESAVVMRFWPNRLSVNLTERTPIAFAEVGSRILLVDPNGVLMQMPTALRQEYSFPVITGLDGAAPLSKRAASLRLYRKLIRDLDAGGANYSRDLDQVDLSDPEDVKVTVAEPDGEVLIHLGTSNFLERYKIFVAHVQEWRQQFQKLDSVDLRYDGQVIVNPDLRAAAAATPAKASVAAKMAPAKAAAAKRVSKRHAKMAVKHGRAKPGKSKAKPWLRKHRASARPSVSLPKHGVPARPSPVPSKAAPPATDEEDG